MNEIIWSLSVDDFTGVMEDNYPDLTEHQKQELISLARHKFSIEDWNEAVDAFISVMLDKLED